MFLPAVAMVLVVVAVLLVDRGLGPGDRPRGADAPPDAAPPPRTSPWEQAVWLLLASVAVVMAMFGLLYATCAGLS